MCRVVWCALLCVRWNVINWDFANANLEKYSKL
jgi:hypothetical protein